jgi:Arc/MetJ family transcription regulator
MLFYTEQGQEVPPTCWRRSTLDDLATAAMLEDCLPSEESFYCSSSSTETKSTGDSDSLADAQQSLATADHEGDNSTGQLGSLRMKMRSMNLRLEIPESSS